MRKMDSDLVIYATVVPTIIQLVNAVSILTNWLLSIDQETDQFRLGILFRHHRLYGLHLHFYFTVYLLQMSQHIQA